MTQGQHEMPSNFRQYDAISAKKTVDDMRKQFNDDLLLILEEEQRKESEREQMLNPVTDHDELTAMERRFGLERAQASKRIVEVSRQHEQILVKEMKRLGIME